MYSFMGGGLFCALVGNILLVVSNVTDYWMQYRLAGSFAHQGLWRHCFSGKCYMQMESIVLFPVAYWNATRAFMIVSALSCFAGIITGILSFAQFSMSQRLNRFFAAGVLFFISTIFILLAMGIYTGVTVNILGKRFGEWHFSWSYILGWVALLMTFFAGSATSTVSYPDFLFLTQPLRISSGICAFCSLLLHFTSLSTSFWVLETTHKGLVHSGLWKVCLRLECKTYWFTLLAPHIHATRAFLLMACFCGLLSFLCICISFERNQIFHTSLTITAAVFSFSAGLFNLIAMSVFTAVHKSSQAYANFLLIFGSSYGLGWASVPMYSITGWFIHATRALLLKAAISGFIALSGICLSFTRSHLRSVPLILASAILSFIAGLLVLFGVSIFTAVYRKSKPYRLHLLIFGSSYGLAWTCVPMYSITGGILILTHKTIIS